MTAIALLAAMILGASPCQDAVAPPAEPAPIVLTGITWLERPTAHDFIAAYPPEALGRHLNGRASLDCSVTADGTLANCSVRSETPPGEGFGEAALQVATHFRMAATTTSVQTTEGGRTFVHLSFVTS